MTRLPKRYFKSISDYVRTYYTAYGAKRAQKLYECVKTVTKGFTRTDPVYVRIGEDGEPEIHYTMTQADGGSYFAGMDLGNATICVHNAKIIASVYKMFDDFGCNRVTFDSFAPDSVYLMFANFNDTGKSPKRVTAFDTSNVTNAQSFFFYCRNLLEVEAFNLSAAINLDYAFRGLVSCTAFQAYGMKVSFDLSQTALKHDAILEVFNNLGKVTAGSGVTLTIGDEKKALMTTEEIKIATDKGWEVA